MPEILAPAEMLSGRAAERLTLSGDHTIVALAGATGSGKSSLFNALTDLELAGVGVRRPTTSWALACAWGPDGAQGLLEWMGIPPRHQVSRMSMLDHSAEDTKLDGLVLLDLPDHDSTEVSHHLEMDRLIKYADLLVWVLDPQKYADAAIHDRYIRPMASYADVTLVVLNQIDRIPFEQRERALTDVKRILADEGLPDVTVIGVSATRGDGVEDLKREMATRIRAKSSAKVPARLRHLGRGRRHRPGRRLQRCPGPGAGRPRRRSTRRSSSAPACRRSSTPCRGRPAGGPRSARAGRSRAGSVGCARTRSRSWDSATTCRCRRWPAPLSPRPATCSAPTPSSRSATPPRRPRSGSSGRGATPIRDASNPPGDDIIDALDRAIHETSLGVARPAIWWRVVQVVQLLLFLGMVGGLGWLAAQGIQQLVSFDLPDLGKVGGVPMAAVVAGGSLVGGPRARPRCRSLASRIGGRRKAKRADRQLREAIDRVIAERVVAPIQAELDAYDAYRSGILAALS